MSPLPRWMWKGGQHAPGHDSGAYAGFADLTLMAGLANERTSVVVKEHAAGVELPAYLDEGVKLRVETLQSAPRHEMDLSPVRAGLEFLQHRIRIPEEGPVVGPRFGGQGDDGGVASLELGHVTFVGFHPADLNGVLLVGMLGADQILDSLDGLQAVFAGNEVLEFVERCGESSRVDAVRPVQSGTFRAGNFTLVLDLGDVVALGVTAVRH